MQKYDKLILALILFSAVALWTVLAFYRRVSPALESLEAVAVGPAGEVRLVVEEALAGTGMSWTIQGAAGEAVIRYEPDRGFAVVQSTCPDQVCVKSGFISAAGQTVVCVPNQIFLRLETKKAGEGGSDGILR